MKISYNELFPNYGNFKKVNTTNAYCVNQHSTSEQDLMIFTFGK